MRTIVLPGYSLSNREWAEEIKQSLGDRHNVVIHIWKHWETGEQKDFSVKNEAEKVLSEIGKDNINIIAKSIGTLVAATLIDKISNNLNKIILCGIPVAFLKDNDLENKAYFNLKKLDHKNVLVIQNNKDPLATYSQIKEMFSKINPQIKVVGKDREDHSYPFFADFEDFLSK